MSVRIPHTAAQLRRMLNLAQMVQSHALSFFYLSSPDLLLGMESDPKKRNIFGVAAAQARPGTAPASDCAASASTSSNCWATSASIPDGWFPAASPSRCLRRKRDEILAMLPEAYANLELALDCLQADRRHIQAGDRGLCQLPDELPGPDQRRRVDRVHRRRAAADRSQGHHHRGRHHGDPVYRGDRRSRRDLQLHQVRLLQAARLSGRQLSRGPAGAAEHCEEHGHAAGGQGTGRVQADWPPGRSRARSTIITRGWSRCCTASRRSSRS